MHHLTDEELRQRLIELEQEHDDLDIVIARLSETFPYDELQMMRLKRKKLRLKDEIVYVKNMLTPDIIA